MDRRTASRGLKALGVAVMASAAFAQAAQAVTFSNTAPIVVGSTNPETAGQTTAAIGANLYPSTITVAGFTGTPTDINVTLNGLTHTFPANLDIILESPSGVRVPLVSDALGGSLTAPLPTTFTTLIIDDDAATGLPLEDFSVVSGSAYKPTDDGYEESGCIFSGTDPDNDPGFDKEDVYAGGITEQNGIETLSALEGASPNGVWKLYVSDDCNQDGGQLQGGWSLDITGTYTPFKGGPTTTAPKPSGWTKVTGLVAGGKTTRVTLIRKLGKKCWLYNGTRFKRSKCNTTKSFRVKGADWREDVPKFSSLKKGSYKLVIRYQTRGKAKLAKASAKFRVR